MLFVMLAIVATSVLSTIGPMMGGGAKLKRKIYNQRKIGLMTKKR